MHIFNMHLCSKPTNISDLPLTHPPVSRYTALNQSRFIVLGLIPGVPREVKISRQRSALIQDSFHLPDDRGESCVQPSAGRTVGTEGRVGSI